ncbi:LysR family transcriptional regulator [Chitinimonas sp.]|uniref:LysR family transcriptional regulator n=1 Tax=Chitinimonas sp. TaxID=1934313 RepID=UPI0035B1F6EB
MKITRLDDLQVFVAACDGGSFSIAARRLDISPALASAAIKRLEDSLGLRLFERTTRRLRLSDAGERLLPHARSALASLEQGEAALLTDGSRLSSPLRLTMPSDLGRNHLLGWLERYLQDQPELRLELHVSDRVADLYQQPIDMAIRYGRPDDSSLIALPLAADNRRVLCATPDYLARRGEPTSLTELSQHDCLCFMFGDTVNDRWSFGPSNARQLFRAQGRRVADDAEVVHRWLLDGQGIAYKSELDVAEDLHSGRLRRLLPQLQGESVPLMLLVINRNHLNEAVRQLAAALTQQCAALTALARAVG